MKVRQRNEKMIKVRKKERKKERKKYELNTARERKRGRRAV